nr:FAD-dependent monooxygenase [uncultured Pelagimonas sp.]
MTHLMMSKTTIAGDACHTHSPKADQGMNVSKADTFNLGWTLAAVLRGQAAPALLRGYSQKRCAKATEPFEFDRDMARLFSSKPKDATQAAPFQRYLKSTVNKLRVLRRPMPHS